MADEEVATKAPESDAQGTSGIEGDTKLDKVSASMGVRWPLDPPICMRLRSC